MHKIIVRLGDNSAARELDKYRRALTQKCRKLVQLLVDNGAEIAKAKLLEMGAHYTGETVDSIIGYYSSTLNAGVIHAGGAAAWVEFGTGIVGSIKPHPSMPWEYDQNNHGESGWWYFDENAQKFRWTRGMPSRPFMYETAKELEHIAPQLAREVFLL